MSPRLARAGALALLLAALPLPSAAQSAPPAASATLAESGPDRQTKVAAQALFDEAMALRKRGAHAESCTKLDESLKLDPAAGTRFYLAECLEQTGRLASAWLLYVEVADVMANTGQQKREKFARERAAALAPRLTRLQIVVPDAARTPALVVRRDRTAVGPGQWGVAIPVDSGPHTVEASTPGMVPFSKTVDLTEPGATLTIELPAWKPLPVATPTAPPPPPPPPAGSPLRTAGWILGGLGAAGLAAGGLFGGLALAKQSDSNRGPCDPERDLCTAAGLALRNDAITMATGSTIGFLAGGIALAAGVVLLLLPTPTRRTALVLNPGGLALKGQW